jgi:hypothetical protein
MMRIVIYSCKKQEITVSKDTPIKAHGMSLTCGAVYVMSNCHQFDAKTTCKKILRHPPAGAIFFIPMDFKREISKLLKMMRKFFTRDISWKLYPDDLEEKQDNELQKTLENPKVSEKVSENKANTKGIELLEISSEIHISGNENNDNCFAIAEKFVEDEREPEVLKPIGEDDVSKEKLQTLLDEIVTDDGNEVDAIFVTLTFDSPQPILFKNLSFKNNERRVDISSYGNQILKFAELLKKMDRTDTGLKEAIFNFGKGGATSITRLGKKRQVYLFFVSTAEDALADIALTRQHYLGEIEKLLKELKKIDEVSETVE